MTAVESRANSKRALWIILGTLAGISCLGIAFFACFVLGVGSLFGLGAATGAGGFMSAVSEGELASDFTVETLDGEQVSLSDWRGTVVAVNFWTTTCPSCLVEMPVLQDANDRYADDELVILAISDRESAARVQAYIDEYPWTFPILLDPRGQVSNQYAIRAYPTTVWVDAEGVIRAVHVGTLSEHDIRGYVEKYGGE
jgi:peroxiredoxin